MEKLVANSLQTSTEGFEKWEIVAYFEFKLLKIVFQISNPVSSPQYQISMYDQWCSAAGAPLRHLYQCTVFVVPQKYRSK